MSNELLSVRHLKTYYYTYGGVVKALDDVNLTVNQGEWVGLVGETGCGKSTLALSILRLIESPGRIVEGEIYFEGQDLLKLPESEMRKIRGAKISMVFQDATASLNPVFTVGDQILEAVKLHQALKREEAWKATVDILDLVGIPSPEKRAKDYPYEFSGGMRQRVMIALALSCQPRLLIADEPTSNLDVTTQAQILFLIRELQRKFGTSILVITHDLGVVAQTCDRVAVMYAGGIVEMGSIMKIFEDPKHPYLDGLLKAIPRTVGDIRELATIEGMVPNLIDLPPGCKFHPRCRYAKEICRRERPREIYIELDHMVACHLYG